MKVKSVDPLQVHCSFPAPPVQSREKFLVCMILFVGYSPLSAYHQHHRQCDHWTKGSLRARIIKVATASVRLARQAEIFVTVSARCERRS